MDALAFIVVAATTCKIKLGLLVISVTFASSSPDWFVTKMQALPSWKSGYFDRPALGAASDIEMSCQGCGGAAYYAHGAAASTCLYCGSAKLNRTLP